MELMPIDRVGRMMVHCPKCADTFAAAAALAGIALVLFASTALGQTWMMADSDWSRASPVVTPVFLADAEATAQGTDGPTPPEDLPQPAPPASEAAEGGPPPGSLLLQGSLFEKWGQDIEHWKSQWPVSVTFGAYNWWHVDNGGPIGSGYGIPGVPGTHSYYLYCDKEEPVDWGDITKIGAHVQMRFRDSGVPLRPFYPEPDFWFWEAYGFVDTPLGRLKAGSIYRQFGLFWDDSFWGNVQYFDGLKLRSDYGVSLEDTPDFKDNFKIDRYYQFFLAQSRISGAILGADSDSFAGSEMRNTFVGRVVPTWKLGEKQTFALGFSATVGAIDNQPTLVEYSTNQVFASPGDQTVSGWAVDGTLTSGPWKLFAEASQLYGILTPCDYISGGPSNRSTDAMAGITYTRGPIEYRCVYSYGSYDDPYGSQGMFVPGITAKITSNVTLWIEYTYWNSRAGTPLKDSVLENGYQMVVDWHF
jgi:hypothetical protein